jgi:diguanylate cyclase (GGDEF)-like protein
MQSINIEFPGNAVELNSSFYVQRPSIEKIICQEITQPGCIIRIKAPQQRGKTSLVLRLIDYTQNINYHSVYLDFQKADKAVFSSIDKLLRWLCASISQQLNLPANLNDYWDEDIGSKISCSVYFQCYLLQQIDNPLVLVFNELNQIFEYADIAEEFFALLRSWHEEAKQYESLGKLRFVLVHSTEIYINLNINKSPFNVGLTIKLPDFTVEEIQELAQRHGLDWTDKLGKRNAFTLKAMVGGHPYLVRLALYHLATYQDQTLDELLQEGLLITGIYSAHLRNLLVTIQENIELKTALQELINAGGNLRLDHITAYKLESLGLIKLDGDICTFSCELYRHYFSNQPWGKLNQWQYLKQLQQENQTLQALSNTDNLTGLYNQRYFEALLNQLWSMLLDEQIPMSLIVLDIDHLKIYNKTYGRELGDNCIAKIAYLLNDIIPKFSEKGSYRLIANRYSGGEFALLVPGRTSATTFTIAEAIRQQVIDLAIPNTNLNFFGLAAPFVTISLGIASVIPNEKYCPADLVQAAREAMEKSKRKERNYTSISTTLY